MAHTKTRSKFWCFSRKITQKQQNCEVSLVETRFSPHFQVRPTSRSNYEMIGNLRKNKNVCGSCVKFRKKHVCKGSRIIQVGKDIFAKV